MKASDIKKIESETKIQSALELLESANTGVRDRDLYFKAMHALKELYLQTLVDNAGLCTGDYE